MARSAERLALENRHVVQAVQASLGSIGAEIRAIFVESGESKVVLHFVVDASYERESEDDIYDIATELEALTWPEFTVEDQVHRDHEVPGQWWAEWRCIYWAKGWREQPAL